MRGSFFATRCCCCCTSLCLAAALVVLLSPGVADAGDLELTQLMNKLEADVAEFAAELERAYDMRCMAVEDCSRANYDECLSVFGSQECPESDHRLSTSKCGSQCSGLLDFNVSSVGFPSSISTDRFGTPQDSTVTESVCFTQLAEDWMKQRYQDNVRYFAEEYDTMEAPQLYFGSAMDGTFRIFPARQRDVCGEYDPRQRPWYIAASSGPKNVVIVLDTSGSVADSFDVLQMAAITLLNSLTEADRVAVVRLNETPDLFPVEEEEEEDTARLVRATDSHKKTLRKAIRNARAIGRGNVEEAFVTAFRALEETIRVELHVKCNAALVLLTDQVSSQEGGAVVALVNQERDALESQLGGGQLTLFTYSVGSNEEQNSQAQGDDGSSTTTAKELACRTGGLWAPLQNQVQMVDTMSNFYRFYALGFRPTTSSERLVFWIEPYPFAFDGIVGTTVSAPVYHQGRFLGVAAMDFTLAAMEQAYGVVQGDGGDDSDEEEEEEGGKANDEKDKATKDDEEEEDETIAYDSQVAAAIQARAQKSCPNLSALTDCQLEALRGEEAQCGTATAECTLFSALETCSFDSVSTVLWNNIENRGKSYEDRVCCLAGETEPSSMCPADVSSSSGGGAGVAVAIVFVLLLLGGGGAVYWFWFREGRSPPDWCPCPAKLSSSADKGTSGSTGGGMTNPFAGIMGGNKTVSAPAGAPVETHMHSRDQAQQTPGGGGWNIPFPNVFGQSFTNGGAVPMAVPVQPPSQQQHGSNTGGSNNNNNNDDDEEGDPDSYSIRDLPPPIPVPIH